MIRLLKILRKGNEAVTETIIDIEELAIDMAIRTKMIWAAICGQECLYITYIPERTKKWLNKKGITIQKSIIGSKIVWAERKKVD